MVKRNEFYSYKRALDRMIAKLKESKVSQKNKDSILKFCDYVKANGMSDARLCRYVDILGQEALVLNKDFEDTIKEDIIKLLANIRGRGYKAWTIQTHIILLKRFYKWLKGNDEYYPDEVKWIKSTISRSQESLKAEGSLITKKEVEKMIESASRVMDKAFISVLYESGCRIGEVGMLNKDNIVFDEHGLVLNINKGKTGGRKIRLIASTHYLNTWLGCHPLSERDAPLWVSYNRFEKRYMAAKDVTLRARLSVIVKKSGIDKRIHPHLFRHSRATELASHLTEFQMNKYFGWVQGSNMPSTYVHLNGRDLDDAILKMNGLKSVEKKEVISQAIKCERCGYINESSAKFCNKCAGILDVSLQFELDKRDRGNEIMDKLMQIPEIQQVIVANMGKLGIG